LPAAFLGGTRVKWDGTSAAVGLLCHFTVAFGAATVYYVVSRKLRVLVQRPVLCGLIYGELVFLFMYFVVIPLSAIGHATTTSPPTSPARSAILCWSDYPSLFAFVASEVRRLAARQSGSDLG
jgi:uncharacterized membrane protein YagU involved in acid resistance